MKKLLTILLTISMLTMLLAGCSSTNNSGSSNTDDNNANTENTNGTDTNDKDTSDNADKTDVTVDEIYEAIKAAYGDSYLPNMEIPADFLESEFGLTSDMYEEVRAEMPMIGAHADRVVVVKAAEGKADAVEAALNAAKESKINESLQYPMNLAKVNATQVVRNGDFVCFLLVGAIDERENPTEEEAATFAKDEVAKAVNAFEECFK